MNVSFNPQEVVVSVLSTALSADIQNPIGREVIQGMDYESGKWTENGNTYMITHRFSREHNNPPFMFIVHASRTSLTRNTLYGQMFINFFKLFGFAPMVSNLQAKYGLNVLWTVTSSTSSISQNVNTITSREMLDTYATNEYFVFKDPSSSLYIRNGLVYNWVAVFMPE